MEEKKEEKKVSLKLNKKMVIGLIVLIFIILLFVIVLNNVTGSSKNSYSGNIYNKGLVAENKAETYYNKYDKGIIKIKNGKEYQITDETAESINVVGDVVYYLTVANGTIDIKSVETNGNNMRKLATVYTSITKIYVVDDYIYYYSNENNICGITKINIDGTNKTMITTSNIVDFQVIGDTIYFTDNINYLYKMTLTGTNVERIETNYQISKFQVFDKWIYFYNENEGALCKVKEDGTEGVTVSNLVRSEIYNITGKKIYFLNPDKKEIASINLNGNGYKSIVEIQTNNTKINIAGNILYYLDDSTDETQAYQIYRVKTNGNSTKAIEY